MADLSSYRKLIISLLGDVATTGTVGGLTGDAKLTLLAGFIGLVKSALVAKAKNEPLKDKAADVATAANAYLDEVLAELAKSA